jgi:hypothetical protein
VLVLSSTRGCECVIEPGGSLIIEIVFAACTLLAGLVCDEKRIVFAEEGSVTPFACAMYGQVAIAKWVRQYPNWSVGEGGYKCRPYKMTAKA